MDIAALFSAENLLALATLTLLEIVLGVDNVVFIAVLSGRLPEAQQKLALGRLKKIKQYSKKAQVK